jgi:hypothetical protein
MPRKEFEGFTRLDASDVNTYLMDQSVMTFADSAARDSAIPTPVEGMVTYLEDSNALQVFDGSVYTSVNTGTSGLDLVKTATFSGALSHSFGSNADPIFTSSYDNYKIIITDFIAASSAPSVQFRVRANTTDLTSSSYTRQQVLFDSSSVTAARPATGTSISVAELSSTANQIGSALIEVQGPALSSRTNIYTNDMYYAAGGPSIYQAFGVVATTDPYNGFTIFTSGPNISGKLSVYGYRK